MKRIPFLLVPAFLISFAVADDQMRDVQTTLKGQGFYYGETDGKENAETGAAIRRFQIRNGLKVTGKLNTETLQTLGLGQKGAAPAAQPPAPGQINPPPPTPAKPPKGEEPPPVNRGKDLLRNPELEPAAPRPAQRIVPEDPAVLDPPRALPAPVYTPFATLFQGTPFEDAPRDVQLDTLRRAQSFMVARRYYRGTVDGIPGPATSEAIFAYQEAYGLRRTGRLDLDTLADMRLLPRSVPSRAPLKPFYNPNRHRDSSITWDFWNR